MRKFVGEEKRRGEDERVRREKIGRERKENIFLSLLSALSFAAPGRMRNKTGGRYGPQPGYALPVR